MTEERNARVTRIGKVVSDKMQKTVVVAVDVSFSIRCTKKAYNILLNLKLMMKITKHMLAT